MQISYCLPIIKEKKEDILRMIDRYKAEYQYIEVWLDYVTDLDEAFVKQLIDSLGEKLVFVLRRQKLEKIKMSLEQQFAIISLLANTDVFLDLDISQTKELKYIKENKLAVKTIVSFHDYEKTPNDVALLVVLDTMESYHPTVYKFATFCETDQDSLRLLQLQQVLKKKDSQHIVLGMGEKGMINRIFGTLFGNKMIFAPMEKQESSAPGQLTKKELEAIFGILKGEEHGGK